MSDDWDGTDRRSSNVSLQDILLEVRELRNEVKHLVSSFNTHLNDDKENFSIIKKDVIFLQRCAFGLFGAWALFQFLISSRALSINNNISGADYRNPSPVYSSNAYLGGRKDASGEGGMVRGSTVKGE